MRAQTVLKTWAVDLGANGRVGLVTGTGIGALSSLTGTGGAIFLTPPLLFA